MVLALIISIFFILFFLRYIYQKKIYIWIADYLRGVLKKREKPNGVIDIMFLFVDHFELNGDPIKLNAWDQEYPLLAKKHKDSDGEHPKHTFFYALDLMYEKELERLQHLVTDRLGEFELHWHHQHDTEKSFIKKLRAAINIFQKYGYMKPYKEGRNACFAFIHGNWSLGNSRGAEYCGVDNEIDLLAKEGCYADFTFPAFTHVAQPPFINNIYYSKDNHKSKSYFKGRSSEVGISQKDYEFMIFQGPLTINWLDWRHKWHPTIEDGDINHRATQSDPKRIDAWMRQGIHIKGQPNWQFVKVFCHGAQDYKSVLGEKTDKMFSYIESNYNDGERYRLHYVTAREAYNIVKAAEEGKSGNPNLFRDYIIPHPLDR